MDDQLPWHVRERRLVSGFPEDSSRVVVHEVDDPNAHPSSPPRLELWETARRPIGSGGQGEVFLQRCHAANGPYTQRAVKIIPLKPGQRGNIRRYNGELETIYRFSKVRLLDRPRQSSAVYRYVLSHCYAPLVLETLREVFRMVLVAGWRSSVHNHGVPPRGRSADIPRQ